MTVALYCRLQVDALVWAMTGLMQRGGWQGPRIRNLGERPVVPKLWR
jgi:hypothetical protein